MDFSLLVGSVQMVLAAVQLKLDHFSKPSKEEDLNTTVEDEFYHLGETIRILEYALSETLAFVGQTNSNSSNRREPNQRISRLWEEASHVVRRLHDGAELSDLTFQKGLYWRNPRFYDERNPSRLYFISLENVLTQLRILRNKYEKLQSRRM